MCGNFSSSALWLTGQLGGTIAPPLATLTAPATSQFSQSLEKITTLTSVGSHFERF